MVLAPLRLAFVMRALFLAIVVQAPRTTKEWQMKKRRRRRRKDKR
jgi:hypothetical protein